MRVLERGNRRIGTLAILVASGLSILTPIGTAAAQSPTTVSPTSPVPTQPLPQRPLPQVGSPSPPIVNVNPRLIVGRWSHTRTHAETRSSDVVTLDFMPDGRYVAQIRSSVLPTPEKPSQGRYTITNLRGNTFTLRIERDLVDPESDPKDSFDEQLITVVDSNTLQAADGSVVRRLKE